MNLLSYLTWDLFSSHQLLTFLKLITKPEQFCFSNFYVFYRCLDTVLFALNNDLWEWKPLIITHYIAGPGVGADYIPYNYRTSFLCISPTTCGQSGDKKVTLGWLHHVRGLVVSEVRETLHLHMTDIKIKPSVQSQN